jgi:uncharacterized membrane protein
MFDRLSKQPLIGLSVWIVVGIFLRLINLSGKPPWIDEFATIVFSLGNSFNSVPLDRLIDFSELVSPLVPNPINTLDDTIRVMFAEDQHPPTYFLLNHLWLKLFPTQEGLVDLFAARLLSVIFGILSIPIIYICSYLIFRSNSIAQFTAGIMAVSPYGVYISQEARHYSFAILWIIISITCLASTCQFIDRHQKLPLSLVMGWLLVNNLGMGSHYFFALVIIAELIALIIFLFWRYQYNSMDREKQDINTNRLIMSLTHNRTISTRLLAVGGGTAIGALIWLKVFRDSYIPVLTDWISIRSSNPFEIIINPFLHILGYLLTIFSLLFSESDNRLLAIGSIPILLLFFACLVITSYRAIGNRWKNYSPEHQTAIITLLGFCGGGMGLFLIFPYLIKMDITLAPRYQFVYFPGIVMLAGIVLAQCWRSQTAIAIWIGNKQSVLVILSMGLIGSLVVASNQGYLKSYDPADLVNSIEKLEPSPILIATTHHTLTQVGELMGIAWEMKQVRKSERVNSTQFLLAHQTQLNCIDRNCIATSKLREVVDLLPKPHDVLLVNFNSPLNLPSTCKVDSTLGNRSRGYNYHLYHCSIDSDLTPVRKY